MSPSSSHGGDGRKGSGSGGKKGHGGDVGDSDVGGLEDQKEKRPAPVEKSGSSSLSGLNRDMSKLSIQQHVPPRPPYSPFPPPRPPHPPPLPAPPPPVSASESAGVSVPISTVAVRPPQRPGFGSSGKELSLLANHFLLSMTDEDIEVCHYDVSITPAVNSTHLNRMIITQLVKRPVNLILKIVFMLMMEEKIYM